MNLEVWLVYLAALFPQLISTSLPLFPHFFLSMTDLIIDGLFLCFYGELPERFAKTYWFYIGQYLNRISVSYLIFAAVLLGLEDIV